MQPECRFAAQSFVALLAATLGGCGCQGTPSGPSLPSREGQTVRVAVAAGPPRLLIERLGKAWANNARTKLEIVPPTGDLPAADLILIPAPDLPRWAAAGKATALPRPESVDPFLPLYRSRLLIWSGTPYAMPVLGDAPICVYRRDLYADPGTQQAFTEKHKRPLKPPETWDEFADQAEFFAARRARPSLPPLPTDDDGLCAAFGSVAAPFAVQAVLSVADRPGQARSARPFSFQYDVDTGEPRVAGLGFAEALTLLKRMQPHRATSPNAAEAMRSDQAVLGCITLADLGRVGTEEAKRWGVLRVPGSRRVYEDAGPTDKSPPVIDRGPNSPVNLVPFVGAGAVVGIVPTGAIHADAAFDLLNFLSGPDASTEVVHTPAFGGGPFREMHIDPQHEQGWLHYGLDERQTALLRTYLREVADPRVDNPALALRIPERTSHIKALAAAIRTTLAGGDPAASLKMAADQWRKLDGTPAKARAEYRLSVGLPP
jgi:multiple sugar transport system substrate-binding protein